MNKIDPFLEWTLFLIVCGSFTYLMMKEKRPTLFIIGDSTVKKGSGKGAGGLWGWGDFLAEHFDTGNIVLRNCALGGGSSRSFITEGHWDKVLEQLSPGDMVMIQFGHNDGGTLDDTPSASGTINGTGEETKDVYNPMMKKPETVHSYGWYMRKYVSDCEEKGAVAIICSPIPRNVWVDGRCARGSEDYGKWAEEIAAAAGSFFIDLNKIVADEYDKLGPDNVKAFFPDDITHTNEAGARMNAAAVATGLRMIKDDPLADYLLGGQ
jgi:rhamnogalacturonan acetylesterase